MILNIAMPSRSSAIQPSVCCCTGGRLIKRRQVVAPSLLLRSQIFPLSISVHSRPTSTYTPNKSSMTSNTILSSPLTRSTKMSAGMSSTAACLSISSVSRLRPARQVGRLISSVASWRLSRRYTGARNRASNSFIPTMKRRSTQPLPRLRRASRSPASSAKPPAERRLNATSAVPELGPPDTVPS